MRRHGRAPGFPSPPLTHSHQSLVDTLKQPQAAVARPVVCVQGLGFAGAAMAATIASARGQDNQPCFHVIGVDLDTEAGRDRVAALDGGRFPFSCSDPKIGEAVATAHAVGNLVATTDPRAFAQATVTVVDVPLDVTEVDGVPSSNFEAFRHAIDTLGTAMPPGSLIVVETTVPPGTCEHVAAPALSAAAERRGLAPDAIRLAHSYERVMPGPGYFDSIVNYWRIYAGHDDEAAHLCEAFLAKVINTKDFPLTRLESMMASETAKILENSYRAVNIAFIDEWSRFAEAAGIDLFEVVDAIRLRPTHNNIRLPGLGVGGYCLTKDPLFPAIAARQIFGRDDLAFAFSEQAVTVNQNMPLANLRRLESLLGGKLGNLKILVLGIAYRSEVDDTRSSPTEIFVRGAKEAGAEVQCHDPYVRRWSEMNMTIDPELPSAEGFDVVVPAVAHKAYRNLDFVEWLGTSRPLIYDTNNVLTEATRHSLRAAGVTVESTGRGLGL